MEAAWGQSCGPVTTLPRSKAVGVEGWAVSHPQRPRRATGTSERNVQKKPSTPRCTAARPGPERGGRRASCARQRVGGDGGCAHSPSSSRPAARRPQPGAGALGSFRRRRCRALPRALRHLRQFPSGPGRHFLSACVSRRLRGSVLVSEALSGSAMDG